MAQVKSVAEWMAERGLGLAQLVEASGLDRRLAEAIAHGRDTLRQGFASLFPTTPSLAQR